MEKEWRAYQFGGLIYQVSNFGQIVGPKRGNVKSRLNSDGYEYVTVGMNPRTAIAVHRIVAQTFVDNPDRLPEVNHLDFDRTNNRADNLEWTTHSANIEYSHIAGQYNHKHTGQANGRARLTESDVSKIRSLLQEGVQATEIARMFSTGESTIYNIKYRNTWKMVD